VGSWTAESPWQSGLDAAKDRSVELANNKVRRTVIMAENVIVLQTEIKADLSSPILTL